MAYVEARQYTSASAMLANAKAIRNRLFNTKPRPRVLPEMERTRPRPMRRLLSRYGGEGRERSEGGRRITKKAYDKIASGLTEALEHVNNMPAENAMHPLEAARGLEDAMRVFVERDGLNAEATASLRWIAGALLIGGALVAMIAILAA